MTCLKSHRHRTYVSLNGGAPTKWRHAIATAWGWHGFGMVVVAAVASEEALVSKKKKFFYNHFSVGCSGCCRIQLTSTKIALHMFVSWIISKFFVCAYDKDGIGVSSGNGNVVLKIAFCFSFYWRERARARFALLPTKQLPLSANGRQRRRHVRLECLLTIR